MLESKEGELNQIELDFWPRYTGRVGGEMPEENPMDESFRKIQKLLDLIEVNLFTTLTPVEIAAMNSELDGLEKKFNEFFNESNKIFTSLGLTKEQMRMIEEGETPQGGDIEASEAYKKAQQLKDRLKDLQAAAGMSPDLVPGKKKKRTNIKSLSKREHKNKYKRLGGSQDWKPM